MTIVYEAPANKELRVAAEGEHLPIKKKKKVWYIFWGLVPITSNSTADIVGVCNEAVRVRSYMGVDDYLIYQCVGGSCLGLMPMTVEVECK